MRLKDISVSIHIVVTLQCPAECVLSCLENCHSSSTLFRHMISSVLDIHVLLCEITTLIFEVLRVHRQNLWKQTCLNLFLKLIRWVAVNEHPLSWRMGMQVQKTKVSIVFMKMHDNLFNRVNWTVFLWVWIDVASIQVDSICIHSIMTSCHSIGVQDWYDIKHCLVSEHIGNFIVFGQLIDDACHNMWAWNLSRMNSCCHNDAFFVTIKCLRLLLVDKQVLIVDWLLLVNQTLFRTYCQQIHRSALQSFCDNSSVKVDVRIFVTSLFDWVEKSVILEIGPGVKESKEDLFIGSHGVLERPLDPSLIEFLEMSQILQLQMCLSFIWSFSIRCCFPNGKLERGRHTRDETKVNLKILDFAYFWS